MESLARLRASSTRYGEIRVSPWWNSNTIPDFTALHPGYASFIQIPNTSLRKRVVVAIDCVLARSSSLFFGTEKPWPAPL